MPIVRICLGDGRHAFGDDICVKNYFFYVCCSSFML